MSSSTEHEPAISASSLPAAQIRYNRFLLLVAGLGGLLYGVDVGIIAGALPYLEATSHLSSGQLSFVVAAVRWAPCFPPCSRACWPILLGANG